MSASNDPDPERSVQIRLRDAVFSITCNDDGDIEVQGDRSDIARTLIHYVHEKLMFRGRSLSDALRVARKLAKEYRAEVLDFEGVRERIRTGWIELLKANLLGDPAQCYGERMNEFLPWRGMIITIEAGLRHVHAAGVIDLSDPEYLIVGANRPWRARWEHLTRISFSYTEPPSEWLKRHLAAQPNTPKALDVREVAKVRGRSAPK